MKTSITPAGKQEDILPMGICFSHPKNAACKTALGPVAAVTIISTPSEMLQIMCDTHYAALHDRNQTLIDDHRAAIVGAHFLSANSIRCLINTLNRSHIY